MTEAQLKRLNGAIERAMRMARATVFRTAFRLRS